MGEKGQLPRTSWRAALLRLGPTQRALVAGFALGAAVALLLLHILGTTPPHPYGSPALVELARYVQGVARYPVTAALFERVPAAVLAQQLAGADICAGCSHKADDTADVEWRRRFLSSALRHDNVSAAVALPHREPPETVHAMSRGGGFVAGGLYEADWITSAIEWVTRLPFDSARRSVLDFGGSSGRVVRVLHAAFPKNSYALCDPLAASIEWAAANVAGVNAFVSPQEPPLKLEARSLDLVYAISIWSHYGEHLAHAWLAEMARLLRRGGHLYLTTHGYQALRHYSAGRQIPAKDIRTSALDLNTRGHHFHQYFGPNGDWGVVNPDWGHAYISPAWMEAAARRYGFKPAYFCVGCEQDNQDIWVLQRL
ncbi:MAG: S-adenosyl-L-methionine-dependent methyltransferase [Monoraphidium minutum]|nr:MAG: S-adenosyl-L-methionine-dependent methyltransferase [Monoraphidium minutum]